MRQGVTHVIFDMDGLLINTEELYTDCCNAVLKPYGKVFDWETKVPTMGLKPHLAAEYIINKLGVPITVDEWEKEFKFHQDEIFSQAKLMPGAKRLVKHLHKHGIPVALCSGSTQAHFDTKTRHLREVFDLFEPQVLCGSDKEVKNGKPHPDAYQVTMKRFQAPPEDPSRVLVFEDAPLGVKSAISAKTNCVMVPDPHIPEHLTKEATVVVRSLAEFDPEEFGLPPYDSPPSPM